MPKCATACVVTFQESIERARADADGLAAKARQAPEPELAELYAFTCAGAAAAVTIAKASRFQDALTPAQFAHAHVHLAEYVARLRAIIKGTHLLRRWPTTPGTTLAQFVGDSALVVAIEFAEGVYAASAWALGWISSHGQYPPEVADRVVSEPNVDPAIAAWLAATAEELRAHTLPPVDNWVGWKLDRDAARIWSLIDDEYRRAMQPPEPHEESFNTARLRELTTLTDSKTLGKYVKLAGVKTPGRGHKNHRYSLAELCKILKAIIAHSVESKVRTACQNALRDYCKNGK